MLDIQGLHIRAALFRLVREFFSSRGFLEVDTPLRQPVIIPECNIEPITADGMYLQTSPELCMKRLLAAGCEKIFQICPCFRKGERGRHHLEEFTMLEWYRCGADYRELMVDCEELLQYVAAEMSGVQGGEGVNFNLSQNIHDVVGAKAKRTTVAEAFSTLSPVPLDRALHEDSFDEILVEYIEPVLGVSCPEFLMDYPAKLASLAKVSSSDSGVAERFELYISGMELANGFSELTDADEQRRRFSEEIASIASGCGRTQEMPERFLSDLDAIDCAAGIAFGLDRLLMLLLGRRNIHEVVSFAPVDFHH